MSQDGATPLFLAAQEGHVTAIRQLLSSGAKVNQPREVMASPVTIITLKDLRDTVREFLLPAGS